MQRLTIILALVFCSACTSVTFVRKDIAPQKQAVLKYTETSSGVGTGFGVGFGGVMLGASQNDTAMYNFVEVSCQAESVRDPAAPISN